MMWRMKKDDVLCRPCGTRVVFGFPSAYALGYLDVAASGGWIVAINSIADTRSVV